MNKVLFHDDLFPKLIGFIDSHHAAMFMRINKLQLAQLDKDIQRRLIQEKQTEQRKRELIVSGSKDNNVIIWDNNGICLKTLKGHDGTVYSVTFNSENTLIVSASDDGTLKIWDVYTGECLKTIRACAGDVQRAAFNHSGSLLVSTSDYELKIWDAYTGECLKKLQGHDDFVNSVAFNPQGTLIVSASDDQTLKIWDVVTGECLKTFAGHDSFINSAAFNPQGTLIVSASDDQTLKIWDVVTGECLKTLTGHTGIIISAEFDPTSKLIVSASNDETIKIWFSASGECQKTLRGHTGFVHSAAFNHLGSLVVSASNDKTVKMWDALTGECLKTLMGHTRKVISVAQTFKQHKDKIYNSIYEKVYSIKQKGDDFQRSKIFPQAIFKQLECLALFKDENEVNANSLRSTISNIISLCQLHLDNYSESLYQSEKALVADSSNEEAQYCICDSLYNLGKLKEAIERINSFLIADPKNTDLIELKNKILIQMIQII